MGNRDIFRGAHSQKYVIPPDRTLYFDTSALQAVGHRLLTLDAAKIGYTSALALIELVSGIAVSEEKYRKRRIVLIQALGLPIDWQFPDVKTASLGTLEIKDWVGERFIFLPKTRKVRTYGYQLFEPTLPYDSWVGKIITVTGVSGDYLPKVTFRSEDGKALTATAYGATVDGIGPLRDLEYARSRWSSKTLWIRDNQLLTWNESAEEFGSVRVKKYSPVEVQDVVASWDGNAPVRLIVKAPNGDVGFRDINVSGTNISPSLREFEHFSGTFLESDPHLTHKWPKKVWDAIEAEKVFIGMTAEQARMSWGNPKDVNRTITERGREEQWVYGDSSYLYVSNGKVSAVQN